MKTKSLLIALFALICTMQGAWADVTVTTESDLRTAVTSSQTVTLGADITLTNGRLDIDGKAVTLNLNGHTLKRLMTQADDGGQVIAVRESGKLTITDKSDNSGKITGGWAYQGGGIFVYEGCELTISGGTISGNRADQKGGGYGFGGAVENHGTMTMTGGVIKDNTAGGAGSGIYQDGTFNIKGNPVVDDLFLAKYRLITLMGALTATNASIGVGTEVDQGNFTTNYSTYHAGVAPSNYFFVSSHCMAGNIEWNSDNKEAKLTLTGYKYIDHTWDQSTKKLTAEEKTLTAGNYSPLGNNIGEWTALTNGGWFVVDGNINIGTLVVHGTSNLVLCNGATLTVTGGVKVEQKANAVLNIYGQKGDTGRLIVTNSYDGAAGIGSGGGSNDGNAGIINIHGGIIDATGNKYGAGIGGGDGHGFGLQANNSGLYVYGGYVTARGGEYAAGIGSGDEPGSDVHAGYVAVYGGMVSAIGGKEGAGIGGGNEGNGAIFSIYGGNVTAWGGELGAGIGGGDEGHSNTTTFYGGSTDATGGKHGAGIGGGEGGYATGIEVRGGNIIAKGGGSLSSRGGGGAGIGGGFEGDCRGIHFYDGTVHATGIDGAAGIGGGKVSDYCELEISGGNITAIGDGSGPGIGRGRTTAGDSSQSSSKKVLINITGGEVTASSNNGGAGIGVGEGTIFNGKINISGGKVTATGRNGGAGIGTGATTIDGEKAFMYGWIIISGGEIIAKGEFDKDAHYDPEVYKPGCGAGIGSGAAGEIYEEGLIQILGGNVTASSQSGGAIGAGGTRAMTGDTYTNHDSWADNPIQINSDNVTLNLTAGPLRVYNGGISSEDVSWQLSPVIRFHANRGGSLSLNGKLAVSVGGTIAAEANRVGALTTATDKLVIVSPCEHSSCTYTINSDNTHTAHCIYCGHTAAPEPHATSGTCVCGYETGVTTYKVTLYTYDESENNYSSIQQEVVTGQTYLVPECDDVPQTWEFVGWVETTNPGTSFEQQTGEILIQPGHTLTAATTLVARYKKIELSLADATGGNISILNKYNGILVASLTLAGRTLYKDGSWNTLCLPFNLRKDYFDGTPLDGATVMTLANNPESSTGYDSATGTLNLEFVDANRIEAGVPYIVKWDKADDYVDDDAHNIVNPVFEQVLIENEAPNDHFVISKDEYVTFTGTYDPVGIYTDERTNLYLGADNKLYYPINSSQKVNSFRAYFQLNKGLTAGEPTSQQAGVRAFVMNFGKDETTGIIAVENEISPFGNNADVWYTIDGRKLKGMPTQRGVYINSGKKIMIK